jgi:hypothetical protein
MMVIFQSPDPGPLGARHPADCHWIPASRHMDGWILMEWMMTLSWANCYNFHIGNDSFFDAKPYVEYWLPLE